MLICGASASRQASKRAIKCWEIKHPELIVSREVRSSPALSPLGPSCVR